MKWIPLGIAVLLLVAPVTSSASGVNLFLNDCSAGSSLQSVTSACTSNAGTAMTLVGSVVLPVGTFEGFVGAGAVIDVLASSSTLPDWWRGGGSSGACRTDAFAAVFDNTVSPGCPTLWDGYPAPLSVFAVQPGLRGPGSVRLNGGAAVQATDAHDLVGDGVTELGVFRMTILNTKSTGDGACGGCNVAACLVLQEITLYHLSGARDLKLTNPVQGDYVTWQTGYPVCPASTPTLNRSWGALKAQYR